MTGLLKSALLSTSMSYSLALVTAPQENVGVVSVRDAPLAGAVRVGAAGVAQLVVTSMLRSSSITPASVTELSAISATPIQTDASPRREARSSVRT